MSLTVKQLSKLEHQAQIEGWLHRDAVAIDQACNVIFLKGLPDETMSSHFERLAKEGNPIAKMICGWLDVVQEDHGEKAQAGDIARGEKVVAVETKSLNVKETKQDEQQAAGTSKGPDPEHTQKPSVDSSGVRTGKS